jgi:trimeric autotransporter adhesin
MRRAAWILLALMQLLVGVVHAAPAAGTWISNQAAATYTDAASGLAVTLTSNTVETRVSQVSALVLASTQSRLGSPGSTLYFPHSTRSR